MLIRSRFTLAFLDMGFNEIPGLTRTRIAALNCLYEGFRSLRIPKRDWRLCSESSRTVERPLISPCGRPESTEIRPTIK